MSEAREIAVLGGGCFWCIEAIYQRLRGVEEVVSGYAGGHAGQVSYEQMHKEETGHAEVVRVSFDPSVISYDQILDVFWTVHDPTTLNRQGNDVGPEYRSIILTTSDQQQKIAKKSKDEVATKLWDSPIVTEIKPLDEFYAAEDYHQDYYNQNQNRNPYCQVIINPKLAKFQKEFHDLLKVEA